jgi:hypothetical protein
MTSENTENPRPQADGEPQQITCSGGFTLPPLSAMFGEDENDG